MPHPHIEQGILMVCVAVKHTPLSFHRFGSLTGSFVDCSLEQLQLETGCPEPVLEVDAGPCKQTAAPCHVSSLWEFLSKHKGVQLKREKDPDSHTPPIRRQHDFHLMPWFVSIGCTGKQLDSLNRVRMFFGISTVADVATGDGTQLRAFAFN